MTDCMNDWRDMIIDKYARSNRILCETIETQAKKIELLSGMLADIKQCSESGGTSRDIERLAREHVALSIMIGE